MDFEAWCAKHQYDSQNCTPTQRVHLENAWRGECEAGPLDREGAIRAVLQKHLDHNVHNPRKQAELQAVAQRAVDEAWDTRKAELELLRADRTMAAPIVNPNYNGYGGGGGASNVELFSTALCLSAGVPGRNLEAAGTSPHVIDAAMQPRLRGFGWHALLRHAMAAAGEQPPAGRWSESSLRHALRTIQQHSISAGPSIPINVSGILSAAASKSLLGSYAVAPAAWRSFAAVRSVTDFKTATAYRPSMPVNLEEVPRGGEIKHGSMEEESYEYSVNTFAKQLQVDRRDIVNDDLGVFNDVLPAMARAAARSLSNLVATVVLANVSGGAPFWSVANLNYDDGAADSLLDLTGLANARSMLRRMKDSEGNLLDLEPAVLLIPPELETQARALLVSDTLSRVATGDNLPESNPFKNFASLVVEPRLSDAAFTGNSALAWYLFSAPENAAVIVAFLDGQQQPTLESFGFDADIDRLAMGWRVYHDYGCALADHRASIRLKGAA